MKNLDLKSALAGVLLTMLVVTFAIVATADKSPRVWDYKVIRGYVSGNNLEALMNTAATDGWELVSTGEGPPTGDTRAFAVMKRPRTRPSPGWWMFWKK